MNVSFASTDGVGDIKDDTGDDKDIAITPSNLGCVSGDVEEVELREAEVLADVDGGGGCTRNFLWLPAVLVLLVFDELMLVEPG